MSESQQGETRSRSVRGSSHSRQSSSTRRTPRSSQGAPPSETHVSITSPRPPPTQTEPPTKQLRSDVLRYDVWEVMVRVVIEGEFFALCRICGKRLSAKRTNGTRHLKDHANRCKERADRENENDGSNPHIFDQNASRKDLATMIILHEYPLSMVEHIGFRRFMLGAQPKFHMVSRNTIKSDILKIYDHEKVNTLKLFENIGSRVAIMTDIWRAKPTKKGFMAITAHFIDRDWILQSRIIRFASVPSPHNHELLSTVLLSCLREWGLERKVSTITLDNASANDAMLENIVDKLPSSSLLLEGECVHMRCCAHILNLIVSDGMKVIESSISIIRESCAYWKSSQGRKEKFENMVKELDVPCRKALVVDCKTRWNSTYFMLEVALEYKEVFFWLKQRGERNYTTLPNDDDWYLAKELVGKLKLFNTVTELFSGTKYITANSYFPKVCEIKETLSLWRESLIEIIRVMACQMLEKYDKYWYECHKIMCIACVLDPRYKMKLVKYYLKALYGVDADNRIKNVEQSCYDLLHEYQSRLVGIRGSDVGSSHSHSSRTEVDYNDPLAKFDLFVEEESCASATTDNSELDMYLKESLSPQTPDFDVLDWWKTNQIRFPILQQMARDILSIPVSSVACESSFSIGGQLVTPYRSRLHHATLEALMCAQSWLWNEIRESTSIDRPPFPPRFCDVEEDFVATICSENQ